MVCFQKLPRCTGNMSFSPEPMQGALVMTPHSRAQLPSGYRALAHNLIKSLEQPCEMVMTVPTP